MMTQDILFQDYNNVVTQKTQTMLFYILILITVPIYSGRENY